jgi:peroxiredoxin
MSLSSISSLSRASRSLAGAALAIVLASGVLGCPQQGSEGGPKEASTVLAVTGGPAPDFAANDIDGNPVKLATYLGKDVVLLDFCSTWCEPCVAEFPHLRTLFAANKSKGFVILAISVDGPETVANVPGFARRNQLSFPMLVDEGSRISTLYNPRKTAPLSVLIDRAGKIVRIHEGYTAGDELALASQVAKALGENGPSALK